MEKKNLARELSDETLDQISGGAGNLPTAKFQEGDQVVWASFPGGYADNIGKILSSNGFNSNTGDNMYLVSILSGPMEGAILQLGERHLRLQ